jgi:NADPH:quinone reductase-like Zn-dependent oxidoreductase
MTNTDLPPVLPDGQRGSANGREPTTGTMQAIVRDRYGDTEVLRLDEVPRPVPGDHDVVVRVAVAGLDRGAWHWMTGLPYLSRAVFGLRRPKNLILGIEVAGTVEAVGPAVTTFSVGDDVFGFGRGAFAEYALVADDRLAHKPPTLSFEHAATLPVSGATALQAVHDHGHVQESQHVLVTGASGGVGSFAVQLAKAAGAHVTGVCSPGKADFVRSLGADDIVDHTREDFADGSRRYDVIIDLAGNPTLARLRRALTPHGVAVLTGGESGGSLTGGMNRQLAALVLSRFGGPRFRMFVATVHTPDLERLAALVTEGKITPRVDRTYPLDQVPDAMRRLEAGQACGKIAITVRSGGQGETGDVTGVRRPATRPGDGL